MKRHRKAVCWSLVLVIPIVVCFAALGDEGSIKTRTTFRPKLEFEGVPDEDVEDVGPGIRDECDIEQAPPDSRELGLPSEGETTLTVPPEPSDDLKPESFFDVYMDLTPAPLRNLDASTMTPLQYVNQAITTVLTELVTNGWYEGVQGDVGRIQAGLRRYVEGQKIGETSASAVVDVLKELRAAAADLREVLKDENEIKEMFESIQPNSSVPCPSTNRGCQALSRMAGVLGKWTAVSGTTSDAQTAADKKRRIEEIRNGFLSMTGATSRWFQDRAQDLDGICNWIASFTRPINGTNASFQDWHSKLGLVEENLQWAFDHAGRADLDERSRLSAVTFGLDMARQFKEDLEKMHKKE